jgi:hypothetical protein
MLVLKKSELRPIIHQRVSIPFRIVESVIEQADILLERQPEGPSAFRL